MGESSFWYRPTRVVPDQRPLNGRCCCCWVSLIYCTEPTFKKWKTEKLKSKKMDMLRSIGKQSAKSVESVPKQKWKSVVRRICRKGRFQAWNERVRGWCTYISLLYNIWLSHRHLCLRHFQTVKLSKLTCSISEILQARHYSIFFRVNLYIHMLLSFLCLTIQLTASLKVFSPFYAGTIRVGLKAGQGAYPFLLSTHWAPRWLPV